MVPFPCSLFIPALLFLSRPHSTATAEAKDHRSALDFPLSARDSGSSMELGGKSVEVNISSRMSAVSSRPALLVLMEFGLLQPFSF